MSLDLTRFLRQWCSSVHVVCLLLVFVSPLCLQIECSLAEEQIDPTEILSSDDLISYLPNLLERVENGDYSGEKLRQSLVYYAERSVDFPTLIVDYPQVSDEFTEALGEDLLLASERVLLSKPPTNVLGLKRLAMKTLKPRSSPYRRITKLFSLAEKSELLYTSRKDGDLLGLLIEAKTKAEKDVVYVRAIRLLYQIANDSLNKDLPGPTLRTLARIEPDWHTKRTHELASKAILKIAELGREDRSQLIKQWPFDEAGVSTLTRRIAELDPGVKITLAEIFADWILHLVAKNEGHQASVYLNRLLDHRPDPSEANNQLRLQIAYEAEGDKAVAYSKTVIRELQRLGGLSIADRVRLMMAGYYGKIFPIIFYLSLFLLIGIFIFTVFINSASSMAEKFSKRVVKAKARTEPDGGVQPAGGAQAAGSVQFEGAVQVESPVASPVEKANLGVSKSTPGYAKGWRSEDEYSRLLAKLGLDDSASEDEIKRAYRAKMKERHPDHHGGELSEKKGDFLEIQEAYKRILQIRSSWFGRKPS